MCCEFAFGGDQFTTIRLKLDVFFVRRVILSGTWLSRITLASALVSIMGRIWHPSSVMLVKFDSFVVYVSFSVVAPMTVNVEISL